jgi:hypothetical protein
MSGRYRIVLKERLFDCGVMLKSRAIADLLKVDPSIQPTVSNQPTTHDH